jgi:hypothetical protein
MDYGRQLRAMATTNNQCLTINLRGSSPVTDGRTLPWASLAFSSLGVRTKQNRRCALGNVIGVPSEYRPFRRPNPLALLPSWAEYWAAVGRPCRSLCRDSCSDQRLSESQITFVLGTVHSTVNPGLLPMLRVRFASWCLGLIMLDS